MAKIIRNKETGRYAVVSSDIVDLYKKYQDEQIMKDWEVVTDLPKHFGPGQRPKRNWAFRYGLEKQVTTYSLEGLKEYLAERSKELKKHADEILKVAADLK